MFSRLGNWCHDHRRLVLGLWVAGLLHRRRPPGRRQLVPRRVQPARLRVPDRVRHPRRALRRRGHRHQRHDRLPGRAGGRRPRGRAADAALFDDAAEIDDVDPRRQPLQRGGLPADRVRGRPGGHHRLRRRRDARRHRLHPGRRDPRRDPRRRARHRGPAHRDGRVHLRRVRAAVVRGAGPRLRHRHPHPGVRLGAGHGPAGRRRPVRHRHRHQHRRRAQPPVHGARDGPVHRPHDRPRRRHRLRPADRHPLPRAAARRAHGARVGRHRHGHRGPLGPVRRHHRGHLAARHAARRA